MANRNRAPRPRWTTAEVEFLTEHWPTKGTRYCAEALGKSFGATQRKAILYGLKADHEAKKRVIAERMESKSTSCDAHYFERDWSPNMAYIVGYIFADGCIFRQFNQYNGVGFLCHSKDEAMILAIKDELKSTSKVVREQPKSRGGPRTRYNISSTVMAKSLNRRFGLCNRKTHANLAMPDVPTEYFGHFLRGYFDGDGCISIKKDGTRGQYSLCVSERFGLGMQDRLESLGLSRNKMHRQENIFVLNWSKRRDLRKLKELMYPEGEYISLARKREKLTGLVALQATLPYKHKREDYL